MLRWIQAPRLGIILSFYFIFCVPILKFTLKSVKKFTLKIHHENINKIETKTVSSLTVFYKKTNERVNQLHDCYPEVNTDESSISVIPLKQRWTMSLDSKSRASKHHWVEHRIKRPHFWEVGFVLRGKEMRDVEIQLSLVSCVEKTRSSSLLQWGIQAAGYGRSHLRICLWGCVVSSF